VTSRHYSGQAGIVIGELKMEKHVQDYVWEMQVGNSEIVKQTFREKLDYPGRRKGLYFGGPFSIRSSG
jgi:hypothetical protein